MWKSATQFVTYPQNTEKILLSHIDILTVLRQIMPGPEPSRFIVDEDITRQIVNHFY